MKAIKFEPVAEDEDDKEEEKEEAQEEEQKQIDTSAPSMQM